MHQLQSAIERVDPQLKLSRNYLASVAKIFNEKHSYKLLLDLLIWMKDYVRAGLTCIKIFLEESIPQNRLKYLELAQHHFTQGFKLLKSEPTQTPSNNKEKEPNVLSESDISKYLKTISLQLYVTKFVATQNIKLNADLTLFGGTDQKAVLCEALLQSSNFELAFQIIQTFRLPITSIYKNALISLAAKKQLTKVEEILKEIKVII